MSSHPEAKIARHISPSPLGDLLITATRTNVLSLTFDAGSPAGPADSAAAPLLNETAAQLEEYFAGLRQQFDLPFDTAGTAFQQEVWSAVRCIAPGTTLSYQALAARIGRPLAMRAVGTACARNPLPVIIPCHRVVGASGAPTGYLGGVARKLWLLRHEESLASPPTT